VRRALKRLDDTLLTIPFSESKRAGSTEEPNGPTAAIIVRDFDGVAFMHSLPFQDISQSF